VNALEIITDVGFIVNVLDVGIRTKRNSKRSRIKKFNRYLRKIKMHLC